MAVWNHTFALLNSISNILGEMKGFFALIWKDYFSLELFHA